MTKEGHSWSTSAIDAKNRADFISADLPRGMLVVGFFTRRAAAECGSGENTYKYVRARAANKEGRVRKIFLFTTPGNRHVRNRREYQRSETATKMHSDWSQHAASSYRKSSCNWRLN